jgi:Na+/H+ antiporter NhaB
MIVNNRLHCIPFCRVWPPGSAWDLIENDGAALCLVLSCEPLRNHGVIAINIDIPFAAVADLCINVAANFNVIVLGVDACRMSDNDFHIIPLCFVLHCDLIIILLL